MDLHQLRSFITVAETGSFSRAALALHLTQPSLSRQIALLEAALEQRLFTRTGRGAALTEAGIRLQGHARSMLDQAERARDDLRDLSLNPSGRVVIGLPPRVALLLAVPLVREFRQRFPRASITVVEGLSLALREQLVAGRIDLALLFDPMPSPKLECEELLREPLRLIAPAGTRLPARVPLAGLADYPMILPSAPNALRSLVDAALLPGQIPLRIVAEVGAVQTALALVAAGVGSTILPASALGAMPAGSALVDAAIGPPDISSALALALPKGTTLSRLTRESAALMRMLAAKMPAG